MAPRARKSSESGVPTGTRPYDWALEQLRVRTAHQVTRGSRDVVVALVDLGYRHHPALNGHLWVNPRPAQGDVHGWDFADDDASPEYRGPDEEVSPYFRGHHTFVAGEIAAVAPGCPIMILRWSEERPRSLTNAMRYAVGHGAKILVIPHGYLTGEVRDGTALFYRGTDFSYPEDNPDLRRAADEAYDAGCLIFQGTADNRDRRVAYADSDFETVVAVGSSNRAGKAADICCSADYVEVGAPGGQRHSRDPRDRIWGYGGDNNLIPFTGGCMACGFAGAVAGLVWSRFPQLTNDQVRQVMRNTARGEGWNPRLGWGMLDAGSAVSLKDEQLQASLRLDRRQCELLARRRQPVLKVTVSNRGALDVRRALVVAYNGDPQKPAAPEGTCARPVELRTSQIGHAMSSVRGLHSTEVRIALSELPRSGRVWLEAYSADRHGPEGVARAWVDVRT
jgi:subtilisin family serine protease